MKNSYRQKATAMVTREFQEYRNSFVWTPAVVAGMLILLMLVSVVVANRITVVGDSIVDILSERHARSGMNITINIDERSISRDYSVTDEPVTGDDAAEDWNFSNEWQFNPQRRDKPAEDQAKTFESVNPLLNAVNCLFLLLLLVTSINYLLGTFNQDRRDGSILFWKSMPVSEAQEVAVKMLVVCLLAPLVYLVLSIVAQLASVSLSLLVVSRMDMDPQQVILDNIDFVALFRGQVSGLLIWMLWTAPFYAWLLLCSAAARRSPLLLALAIPVALIILEQLFIGSDYVSSAIGQHIPHLGGEEGSAPLGFYFGEPQWGALDFADMLLGLLAAAALLLATTWFRKHRFES